VRRQPAIARASRQQQQNIPLSAWNKCIDVQLFIVHIDHDTYYEFISRGFQSFFKNRR